MRVVSADPASRANVTIEITPTELYFLFDVIYDRCHGGAPVLEEWEFATVTGLERDEALRMADELKALWRPEPR